MSKKNTMKPFIVDSMTEKEAFQRLHCIPRLSRKIDKILMILEGDGTISNKGIVDTLRDTMNFTKETNGKVKQNTKMIYSLWGALSASMVAVAIVFIQHLVNTP